MTTCPQFFSDPKRGEINELKKLLITSQHDHWDYLRQREVLKKVIAFMTMGIDVARLFSEMLMACSTSDVVQKKMIYFYLISYAEKNQHLSLLAVNTLQKDCIDHDPAVRGLALKSLCSMKTPNIFEYLEPAVRSGLSDRSEYVRRTAVMGVLRIFRISPESVIGEHSNLSFNTENEVSEFYKIPSSMENESLLRIVFALLNDIEPQVVCNAIFVLNEILASSGGLPVTRGFVIRLLNRLKRFRETSQCIILNILSNYRPSNENEVYDVMNILEDLLKHSSAAVLLATIKCFLILIEFCPLSLISVIKRLRPPLLTLIVSVPVEQCYVVLVHLRHILVLCDREAKSHEQESVASQIFGKDFKLFFLAFHDPVYIKIIKIDLLTLLVSKTTTAFILDELVEYVVIDPNKSVVCKSIEAIGTIAFLFPEYLENVTDQLIGLMQLSKDYITSSCFVVLQRILERKPHYFSKLKHCVECSVTIFKTCQSFASWLWILGKFGHNMPSAPSILEEIVTKGFATDDLQNKEQCHSVTLHEDLWTNNLKSDVVLFELITATMRLLIIRAPEMQIITGKLFDCLLNDDEISFDVRDRVILLYRFLREATANNYALLLFFEKFLHGEKHVELPASVPTRLENIIFPNISISEFNTLSILLDLSTIPMIRSENTINLSGKFISCCFSKEVLLDESETSNKLKALCTSTDLLHIEDSCNEPMKSTLSFKPLQMDTSASVVYNASSFQALWNKTTQSHQFTNQVPFDSSLLTESCTDIIENIKKDFSKAQFHCIAAGSPKEGVYKWFAHGLCIQFHTPITILLKFQIVLLNTKQLCLDIKIHPLDSVSSKHVIHHIAHFNKLFSLLLTP
ncbi:uncharacterized protein LOC128882925 [Hylaeus volcanicus]|uniref:uncharacterized protein LOC128882925 n=1 Tax=Hylaeus volcanicus TaxID=313075 RepID=UPI0023B794A7|nr:uncharacterized protein LOC128882925 [Hylaeus volcanicus]